MAQSFDLTFPGVLEIARGKTSNVPDINDKDIPAIRAQLRKDIDGLILNNLNVGLDPEHPGPKHARRSLNHTALLYKLSGGHQVQLDMQNQYETKLGQTAPGVYAVKFTPYQGASDSKSTMITELPWYIESGIRTLQELILTLGHFSLGSYTMTAQHQGCRFHAKGILELQIEAGMTHLDVYNTNLGWQETIKTFGKSAREIYAARVKVSRERLETYFSHYFNLSGQAREVARNEGKFDVERPSGELFWKYAKFTLPDEIVPLDNEEKKVENPETEQF